MKQEEGSPGGSPQRAQFSLLFGAPTSLGHHTPLPASGPGSADWPHTHPQGLFQAVWSIPRWSGVHPSLVCPILRWPPQVCGFCGLWVSWTSCFQAPLAGQSNLLDSLPSWYPILLFLEIPQDPWDGEVFQPSQEPVMSVTFLPSRGAWGEGERVCGLSPPP